jgi:hypothetical protein
MQVGFSPISPISVRMRFYGALLRFAPQSSRKSKDLTQPVAQCAFSLNPTGTVSSRYLAQLVAAVDTLVETTISRIKRINSGCLTSRTFVAQQNEVTIHINIANSNMTLARPVSERVRGQCYKASATGGGLVAPKAH